MLKTAWYQDVLELKTTRTFLKLPVYFSYFYYVDGLLIDTGPTCVAGEVIASIRELAVEKVVITHQHEDHTGNCLRIQEELGVPVYANPETLNVMAEPPSTKLYRKLMWGNQPPAAGKPLAAVIETPRYRFRVIDTPGHSHDHVSFFEPTQKWLFCGDLYLSDRLIGFMDGENIVDHLISLQRVISLQPRVLFCGLKGRLEDATARLCRKYIFWWHLGCRINKMHAAGKTRKEIMRQVFGGEVPFYYLSQYNWGRKHMLDSIIENSAFFDAEMKKQPFTGCQMIKQETEHTHKPSSVLPFLTM